MCMDVVVHMSNYHWSVLHLISGVQEYIVLTGKKVEQFLSGWDIEFESCYYLGIVFTLLYSGDIFFICERFRADQSDHSTFVLFVCFHGCSAKLVNLFDFFAQ